MTARGPNGACPTDRRSQPARPEALERFPARWIPVSVKKTRQIKSNKQVGPRCRFNRNGKGSNDVAQRQTTDRTGRSAAEVIAARAVPATRSGDAWSSAALPRRFLMTLLACLATVGSTAGAAPIVTDGPPSVAILIEALSASAEAGGPLVQALPGQLRSPARRLLRMPMPMMPLPMSARGRHPCLVRGGGRNGSRRRCFLLGRTFRDRHFGLGGFRRR